MIKIKEKKSLYIPVNLKNNREIFKGFSKKEIMKAMTFIVALGVINLVLFLIYGNSERSIVMMMITIVVSIMLFGKDNNNTSVVEYGAFVMKYERSQKEYVYRYVRSDEIEYPEVIKRRKKDEEK